MEFLVNVVLPLSLAVIMLSLGIGLTLDDFRRVVVRRRVFAVGALCQVFLIPVVVYVCVLAFGLTGEIAVWVMLLPFCPDGVASNIVSKHAQGDVAL
jgi:BASS family bile acid:Na+ symporter